jgi:hypothetical protein
MRNLLACTAAALFAMATSSFAAITLYTTPDAAAKHCKSPVVWLNTKTGVYHIQGSKDYGNTKDGAYVCQKSADRAGDRPAMNGQ